MLLYLAPRYVSDSVSLQEIRTRWAALICGVVGLHSCIVHQVTVCVRRPARRLFIISLARSIGFFGLSINLTDSITLTVKNPL